MKPWVVLIIGIATQCYALKVTLNPNPINQKQEWSWQNQDLIAEPNMQYESFKPVSFTVNDAINQQSNVQSGSSGVAQALDQYAQQSQQIESMIEDILGSTRQGRNLEGFDEIYSDPNVKNALQQGNDTIARSYIKDKLCTLGLMNCEDIEERRPYYPPHRDIHPQEVILAQPVTIKPVGRPLPAVPVKRPYGPPKPLPIPSLGSGPIYSGPPPPPPGAIYGPPPPSFVGPYPAYKKPGFPTGPKPVYEPGFLDFDDKYILDKKQSVVPNSHGVQQHVHHHYHHNDGVAAGAGVVGSGVVGAGPIGNGFGYGNGGTYGNSYNDFDEYKKAFKVKESKSSNNLIGQSANNYANRYPVYEKPKNDNAFDESSLNKGIESAKQFNPAFGGASGLGPQGGNFGNNYGYESNVDSSFSEDCICVPYEQCATINQLGRKDDLFLDIDPRNLDKNIEAETVEVMIENNNGTMSVIRVSKNVNTTEEKEVTKEQDDNKEGINKRSKREAEATEKKITERDAKDEQAQPRQFGRPPVCGPRRVCCRRHSIVPNRPKFGECGVRNSQGINGRIKNPEHVDGDSEFGEYPWQVAILKKDTTESVYVCGGTLISSRHIITAAHCVKTYKGRDLRARLGEWDVNHDVEFFPHIERDIVSVYVHPEFYAGTLYNDISILQLDHDVDFEKNPHISPACLPSKSQDFTGHRCWTTGWGKDAFGDYGKYQNILKEVDVPVISNAVCEHQMRRTRLGHSFNLHSGFICAGGEEGKDACKGDGGGPMVCEHHGKWQLTGVVSWGIGCGQAGVPGVYSKVSHYLDWIQQIVGRY